MLQEALGAVGQTYRNFCLTKYLPLPELESTLVELTHEPTGARVIHIANNDPENLFCLSLRTLPDSSNGVAHILEHTVLCGSQKYQVKDPQELEHVHECPDRAGFHLLPCKLASGKRLL